MADSQKFSSWVEEHREIMLSRDPKKEVEHLQLLRAMVEGSERLLDKAHVLHELLEYATEVADELQLKAKVASGTIFCKGDVEWLNEQYDEVDTYILMQPESEPMCEEEL